MTGGSCLECCTEEDPEDHSRSVRIGLRLISHVCPGKGGGSSVISAACCLLSVLVRSVQMNEQLVSDHVISC